MLKKLTNAHKPKRSFYAFQKPQGNFFEWALVFTVIAAARNTLPTCEQKREIAYGTKSRPY